MEDAKADPRDPEDWEYQISAVFFRPLLSLPEQLVIG